MIHFSLLTFTGRKRWGKIRLWNFLSEFKQRHDGLYTIFGDFNEVREEADRFGTIFNPIEANHFNNFINNGGLIDMPIGGRRFTWMKKSGTKMSLIDRFLISHVVAGIFHDARLDAFNRGWSDHVPLFFHVDSKDFGHIPFKVFSSWMQRDGFKTFVEKSWIEDDMNVYFVLENAKAEAKN
ncbi:uncharacterized protein [Rutidosis leptorrhynchoides]|uniref:uncharacterized protein n=1 Tax=Rutidosis leptorrhynchoides TaxID=125765 RepID=UPI003A99817C